MDETLEPLNSFGTHSENFDDQPSGVQNLNEQYIYPPWIDAASEVPFEDLHTIPVGGHLNYGSTFDNNLSPTGVTFRNVDSAFEQWHLADTSVAGQDDNIYEEDLTSRHLTQGTIPYDSMQIDPLYSMTAISNTTVQPQAVYVSPVPLSPEQMYEQADIATQAETQKPSEKRTRQPAWGTSNTKPKRQSLTDQSPRQKTQTKSKTTVAHSETSRRRSARSIQGKGKSPSSAVEDDARKLGHKERSAHNIIEKQYRNRLNSQYETLLRALPPDAEGLCIDTKGGDSEEKVSKAEVLVSAKTYIHRLEKEESRLVASNEQLGRRRDELEEAWVKMGGIPMP